MGGLLCEEKDDRFFYEISDYVGARWSTIGLGRSERFPARKSHPNST